MRLTHKVFTDLAIWMVAFGLGVGLLFPLFLVVLGVPAAHVLSPGFFAACLTAGAVAGLANQALARLVVGSRLRLLAERMEFVAAHLRDSESFDPQHCSSQQCYLAEDSDDEIGASARAFNDLVHALAEAYRTEQLVRSFSDLMVSRIELAPLAEEALQHLLRDTGASGGALLLEQEGELRVYARQGMREDKTFVTSDALRLAMKDGTIRLIQTPDGVRVDGVVLEFVPREVFVVPILYKDVTLGAVVLACAQPFEEGSRVRLEFFRRALSLALRNAIAHDNLQRLAALDPLTGMYNRRFGIQRLREEFSRAVRAHLPLAVLMLDIDHFKRINDTYGHLVGDRVLVKVARLVRSLLREGDVLLRYGGEEFLAILPGASCSDAETLALRLHHAVEDLIITHGEQTFHITISIGVASYPEAQVDRQDELIRLADERLYRAKQSGRNCVVAE